MFPRPIHQSILAALALATLAVAQNAPADGSFQVRYAANLGAQTTSVIYSTSGSATSLPFNAAGTYAAVSQAGVCPTVSLTIGMQFTAQITGPLQGIAVVISGLNTTDATFELKSDVGAAPGAPGAPVLETFKFTNIPAEPNSAYQSLPSVSHPVLTAGTKYWLVLDPPVCDGTFRRVTWNFADAPSVPGFANATGSPTFSTNFIAAFALWAAFNPDPVINFTNTGANNTQDICVNTYTFAPDEQLISCCSCRVTRNALWSLSVRRDLTRNTLTPAVENSVVVKLLATAAPGAGNCNPALPGAPVQGLAAWGTTFHLQNASSGTPYASETPFTNSSLSNAEQTVMTSLCGFIQGNGSGYGICRSCQGELIPIGISSQNRGLSGEKGCKIIYNNTINYNIVLH